jgi:hypothetical protein
MAMAKALILIACLSGNSVMASDINQRWWTPTKQLVGLIALSAFTLSAFAQDNSTNLIDPSAEASSSAPILCTLYFTYWATWLGNVYGIFDAVGWTTVWLANGLYYIKRDPPALAGLKKHLKSLQEAEAEAHKKQISAAANICDTIITHLKSNELDMDNKLDKKEILHCINLAKEILIKEAQVEQHVAIPL